jgi:glycosyltransferase involved in cell wall biosynthesis
MRILIIHTEANFFAGAEKMLGHYLEGLKEKSHEVAVAVVGGTRMAEIIPPGMAAVTLSNNQKFSLRQFTRQLLELRRFQRNFKADLVHGWAARDWDVSLAAAKLFRLPAAGTLHDHPAAPFHTAMRQRLMRWSAAGLGRVVCVSDAVRQACVESGYSADKLTVVHNGLPLKMLRVKASGERVRIGFLGVFLERKGFRGLFKIMDELGRTSSVPLEMWIGGGAQEPEGERMVEEIKSTYAERRWWNDVKWCGWVKDPTDFLGGLDLMVCPSSEFDPFPTVLLEAAHLGVPVVAAKVGGVNEIVRDGETGWLFRAEAWEEAAVKICEVVKAPDQLEAAGLRARERAQEKFALTKMVAGYRKVYSTLMPNV